MIFWGLGLVVVVVVCSIFVSRPCVLHPHPLSPDCSCTTRKGEKHKDYRSRKKSVQGSSFWRKTEAEGRTRNSNIAHSAFFQVQVASNYKAIKQRLHLESQDNLSRRYCSFFPVNIWFHCSWWMEGNLGTKPTFTPYADVPAFMGSWRSARILEFLQI